MSLKQRLKKFNEIKENFAFFEKIYNTSNSEIQIKFALKRMKELTIKLSKEIQKYGR